MTKNSRRIEVRVEEIAPSHGRSWDMVLKSLPKEDDHFEIDGEGFTVKSVLHSYDTAHNAHDILIRVR